MHSALIVVKPPETQAEKQRWQQFASAIAPLKQNPAVDELADNVWLIDFEQSPLALAQLLSAAHRHQFSQKTLQLPEAPKWLRTDVGLRIDLNDGA